MPQDGSQSFTADVFDVVWSWRDAAVGESVAPEPEVASKPGAALVLGAATAPGAALVPGAAPVPGAATVPLAGQVSATYATPNRASRLIASSAVWLATRGNWLGGHCRVVVEMATTELGWLRRSCRASVSMNVVLPPLPMTAMTCAPPHISSSEAGEEGRVRFAEIGWAEEPNWPKSALLTRPALGPTGPR